jgi:uncharacterized 2Fe-2S/4Fe-4S cluster protein (DUF4445 family)
MMPAPRSLVSRIRLTPPSLGDNTADADRLVQALKTELETDAIGIDLALLKRLPDLLRAADYQIDGLVFRERRGWRLLDICPRGEIPAAAGLAVDLGTTRVVLRLIQLFSGQILAESAFDNPQAAIGSDVLARIHHAETESGLAELHESIIGGVNQKTLEMCREAQLLPEDVAVLVLAGNTAMSHLFLGLPPRWMIREPYIPVVNTPDILPARDLGLAVNPAARVLVFPNVGSYFGGDLIAGILHSGLSENTGTSILVDVGTNAEVVIGNDQWLMACAGAAGPALEGGVTKMGMNAAPGVIDRVRIDSATLEFEFSTIGNQPPRGICGSGLIDLAASLYLGGMVDIRGKFVADACGEKLTQQHDVPYLVVVPREKSATGSDLTLSQADLDSLVRSKAAMYTILETITESVGVRFDQLETFFVAGTFGAFIDPRTAITIGMIPDLPLERYQALGNSSLEGASMMLTGRGRLATIDRIRDRITYLELNVNQAFMNRFSAARFIPHTNRDLFPSVK